MDISAFKEAMERGGMRVLGTGAFGVVDGYPLMAVYAGAASLRVTVAMGPQEWRLRKAELKTELRKFGPVAWAGDRLVVSFRARRMTDGYRQAVLPLARTLKDLGIAIDDTCPVCGRGGCEAAAPYGQAYRPVHRACLESALAGTKESAAENRQNGSYLSGIAGAILGGIVGVIPSLLTVIAVDTVYAILFALVPLCAYYGYKLFKGKMDRTALICSIVMGILSVYILNFSGIGYILIEDYGMTFGRMLQAMPAFLGDISVWGEITRSSITQFIFAAIGIFLVWGAISRTAAGEVANAESVLAMSMPLRPENRSEDAREEDRPDGE